MIQIVVYPIITVVLLWLFMRWFERANVWMPSRNFVATPEDIGLDYEDVFFDTTDGVCLHGWYIPHETPAASLLFCHGNAGNVSYRLESIRQFHSLGLNVFIFDYRGYGKSRGRPSERGTYIDAQAAFAWLSRRGPERPIVLFGRSLGAAVAVDLAVSVEASALICESGFTSVPDMGRELFPFLPVRWFCTIQYDSLAKIPNVHMPVLVIHAREDTLIPYRHGERLYRAAPEPKTMLTIHGDHNDGFITSEAMYLRGINSFLEEQVLKNES